MSMEGKLSQEEVRVYWTGQALAHGQSPAASWSDTPVIDMEIREISKHLRDGDRVLDVGCANGYSTAQLAAHRRIAVRGLDYIPEMVSSARQRVLALQGKLLGSMEFDVGDIRALAEPTGAYDRVVAIRVLINLPSWDEQARGLRECARVLKPGGTLLVSEATLQGWENMNKFRMEWGLPDIPMPAFNRYLDQDAVAAAVPELELAELSNFASTYFVGTRVLKPLLARALRAPVNVADPGMQWNRWFAQLPPWGDYGTQKLFVFRKAG